MMVYLTRRYRFSAGHRLHNDALSAEENRRVYGKCNNPNGHGHNYLLEVTVAGAIDPATGMVFDLVALDGIVAERVLEKLDHKKSEPGHGELSHASSHDREPLPGDL